MHARKGFRGLAVKSKKSCHVFVNVIEKTAYLVSGKRLVNFLSHF